MAVGGKPRKRLKSGAVPSLFGEECNNMVVVEEEPVIGAPKKGDAEINLVPSLPTTADVVMKKEPSSGKPYPCQMCRENLNSLEEFYEHLQRTHNYMEKVYLCRLCHHISANRSLWFSHYSRCQRYVAINGKL